MIRVDLEKIKAALAVIDEFNELDLNEVELYEGGELIKYPPGTLEKWRFVGLTNKMFVEMNIHRDGMGEMELEGTTELPMSN
jgi:hypothetical protein